MLRLINYTVVEVEKMLATVDILTKIENHRNNMVSLALQTSFTNERVVEMSAELDQLLNQFEQLKRPGA